MRRLSILVAALLCAACEPVLLPTAEGEQGPQGEPGAPAQPWRPTTYIVDDYVELEPGEWATVRAMCDDGAMALHGGCAWGDWREHPDGDSRHANVRPYLSTPIGQETLKHAWEGWQCTGVNEGEVPTRVHVVVTCLELE